MTRRWARGAICALGTTATLLIAGCGGGDGGADDRAKAREAFAAIDAAVGRVENEATRTPGRAGRRVLELRALLDKWQATHTGVFAIDPSAGRARIQSVLDGMAAIAPESVIAGASGAPAQIDPQGLARALTPGHTARSLARREGQAIEEQVDRLAGVLDARPASTVIFDPARDGPGGTADDVLVALQDRLQRLYPHTAARVMELRIDLIR